MGNILAGGVSSDSVGLSASLTSLGIVVLPRILLLAETRVQEVLLEFVGVCFLDTLYG